MTTRIPTNRRPTSPGEMLLEEFIKPIGISQKAFAQRLGITVVRLNELILGKRSLSVDSALRLEQVLGMSADFWMRLQLGCDLYDARHSKDARLIAKLTPLKIAANTEAANELASASNRH